MKLSIVEQFVIGLWLSCAIGMGIMVRTTAPVIEMLIMGAFLTAPLFLCRGLRSSSYCVRGILKMALIAWFSLFIAGILIAVERVYFMNATTYPHWLASGELKPGDSLKALREGDCKGRSPMLIFGKADGIFVIRCGETWTNSKTYIAHFNPTENAQ